MWYQRAPIGTRVQRTFTINPTQNELLVTAQVCAMDRQNRSYHCWTLLDTCSSKNFISSEGLAKKLQLPRKRCHIPIGAINKTSTVAKYYTTATIRSQSGNYIRSFSFIIIPTISNFIPDELIDRKNLKIPRNIRLADSNFHRPSPVDMLLGAEPTLSLICDKSI